MLALLGMLFDALQLLVSLTGNKSDDEATKLVKNILDKLDELRRGQQRLVQEIRVGFAEAKEFQIQLYVNSMNNEMQGYLLALKERVDEIPHFKTPQGREENRRGLLALRDAAEPHIYAIIATGPIASQGMVIGYGFFRCIFDALQRTAPDRQVRMEYRISEAKALKSFAGQLVVFTAPTGADSVRARLAEVRKAIDEKTKAVDAISKNPSSGKQTENTPVARGVLLCTRVVVWERVWTITGSIKEGWTDTNEVRTYRDEVVDCHPRDEPPPGHGGRGGGPEPAAGEFDPVQSAERDSLLQGIETLRMALISSPSVLASTHPNTDALNALSAEIRSLTTQATILEAIVQALDKTLENISVRQKELPKV